MACTPLERRLSYRSCLLQVGPALSVVYTSDAPIMFCGAGQTYISVSSCVVRSLMN